MNDPSEAAPKGAWQELARRFEALRELPTSARDAQLAALRAEDPHAASTLEALLAADASTDSLLDTPFDPGASEVPATGALLGTRWRAWELCELLGAGGSAEVYRARRVDGAGAASNALGSDTVAIKVLHTGHTATDLARRFVTEGRALASLGHPGIVALHDTGDIHGRACLVTEFVDGVRIDRHVREAGLDRDATLALALQLCDAVAAAHRNLIVHRDLKPANILVDRDGRLRVLDFGVAKLLAPDAGDEVTHPGSVAPLTLRYASPEQAAGAPISTATDVYSLGVLLRELLGDEVGANADLSAVLARATERAPEARYPSVDALADDLRCVLAREPVRARSLSRAERVLRFLSRHRLSAALSLAADPGLLAALDEAARRVGTDFVDHPEAEGRLRYSIALLYAHLDLDREALPHAERAAEIAATNGGFDRSEARSMQAFAERLGRTPRGGASR